jgi:RNA polymerase sigma-70 factor (ECF subfamily)
MGASEENERFILLYARHETRLRRYICALVPVSADVDDVLQETAVAIMRKFGEYDCNLPFFNWACRFAFYEVMRYRKQAKTRRRYFSDQVVEAIARDYQQHEQLSEQRRQALAGCLRQLADQDRRLVELRYAGADTVASLAERVGEPVSRLYRSLVRIRRMLAVCVQKKLALES